ncbi:MAG: Hsp20 family protein [Puniceicoccales bacterium]|jgi:HSP20 family protein|nr:Hsp20 family protein [Puniceicoccales bacterium]
MVAVLSIFKNWWNMKNMKFRSLMLVILGYLAVVTSVELSADSFEDFCDQMNGLFDTRYCHRRSLWEGFKLDIKSTKKEYVVEVEIPGVKKSEIDLNVEDQVLCISVCREKKVTDEKDDYLHRERHDSTMERSICLRDADFKQAKAKLENGILTITIAKQKKSDNVQKIIIE